MHRSSLNVGSEAVCHDLRIESARPCGGRAGQRRLRGPTSLASSWQQLPCDVTESFPDRASLGSSVMGDREERAALWSFVAAAAAHPVGVDRWDCWNVADG